MLHYQKDLILERMNRVFGEQWISDIRFVDVAMAAKAGVRRKRGRYSLNDGQQEELTGMLADIGDDDIKARLARLGEYVLLEESS